jgi:hypothetical protein
VRAYGSRWGGRRVIDRMLRAYAVKDTTMISLIQQEPTFKKMSSDDVFGKIINHEMLVEEANMSRIYPRDHFFKEIRH